jgi:hypothetical protein
MRQEVAPSNEAGRCFTMGVFACKRRFTITSSVALEQVTRDRTTTFVRTGVVTMNEMFQVTRVGGGEDSVGGVGSGFVVGMGGGSVTPSTQSTRLRVG